MTHKGDWPRPKDQQKWDDNPFWKARERKDGCQHNSIVWKEDGKHCKQCNQKL